MKVIARNTEERLTKKSFTEELRKTFKKIPDKKIDFKKEWYKYLEEKYCG